MEKAIKYVRDNGIQYTKERIEHCKGARLVGIEVDLKQIVEAFELVESYGGYDLAKEVKNITPLRRSSYDLIENLKQAIELVEKCNASD